MMRKTVLTSKDCSELIPHWFALDPLKLEPLKDVTTRISKFGQNGQHVVAVTLVIATPPILISKEGIIINGKHRASIAALTNRSLEACVVSCVSDIVHHTPLKVIGDLGIEKAIATFEMRLQYVDICKGYGITAISDFYRLVNPLKTM